MKKEKRWSLPRYVVGQAAWVHQCSDKYTVMHPSSHAGHYSRHREQGAESPHSLTALWDTLGSHHGALYVEILDNLHKISLVQFCSVARSCPTLCDPMDCGTPGFPVHHQLPKLIQTHVYHVRDAIQSSHPLWSPSPPAFHLSYHQGLFQWVSSSHQVAKVLEFQLQHQSVQWIFRTDFL